MKFENGVEISAIANTAQNTGTPFTNSIKADYEVSRRPLPFFMGEWRTKRNLLPSANTALTTLMKTRTRRARAAAPLINKFSQRPTQAA